MDLEKWHKSWRLVACDDGLGAVECLGCNRMSPPGSSNRPFEHDQGCLVATANDQYPWADLRDALAIPGFVKPRSALDGVR